MIFKKNKKILFLLFFFCIVLFVVLILKNSLTSNQKPLSRLKILTYSSFVGLYGPGRFLQKEFEKKYDCKIEWFVVEDSTTLRQRLAILSSMDLVIGLDQISVQGISQNQWKNIAPLKKLLKKDIANLHLKTKSSFFIPIDWAPIGFLSKKSHPQIYRLKDLHQANKKISFPEPRTSTLGLQFYYWIYEVFQKDVTAIKSFLKQIKPIVYGPVFSWSLAYGYFQKGRVGMGLSYLSSLNYHLKEENSNDYFFHYFEEGHPYQLELAGIPSSCNNCDLSYQFLEFILSPKAQSFLEEKNYMFSVIDLKNQNSFKTQNSFKKPSTLSYQFLDDFISQKEELLELWKSQLY